MQTTKSQRTAKRDIAQTAYKLKWVMAAALLLMTACEPPRRHTWETAFMKPKTETTPWTFWYWMYGSVSDTAIRADLVAMKQAGIAGFYLMPIKGPEDCKDSTLLMPQPATQLSKTWWDRLSTVCKTADSLGLKMGIHFSDGFALAGGPWIREEQSMQKVVWRDTVIDVKGERDVSIRVAEPKHKGTFYKDIATYIMPETTGDTVAAAYIGVSKQTGLQTKRKKRNTPADVFPIKSKEPIDITFSYDAPFTLRSLQVRTGGNNYQAHRWTVLASDNGTTFDVIDTVYPARQGWQNTDEQATYAIRPTTARHFRFHWEPEGSEPGCEDMDAAKWSPTLRVAELIPSKRYVVDGFEGKNGSVWRVSDRRGRINEVCATQQEKIITVLASEADLSKSFSQHLTSGRWRVIRMGHASTGHTNATGGGARGLECNKFDTQAIKLQAREWFGRIHHFADSVAPGVLTRLHVDSWECGSQNWSENFAREFRQRRGYDLLPLLPVMAGVPIDNEEKSDEILHDIRRTVADLIQSIFWQEVRNIADQHKVELSAECVCPTMVSDGLSHYMMADYPMGEFWLNSPTHDKPNDMLDAISGGHLYGKNRILAEGFTEVRGTWDETPNTLKPLLDRNYCLGINGIVFHVNTHNPWMDKKPGMTLDGIGTFFQRDNTWWPEMGAFTTYIARCQALLQYGQPVVDLAVYAGDEIPCRALLPERLVETLPGLFGPEAIEREKARLANEGTPVETSPVGVRHTANMTKADMFTNPLRGYKYDSFSRDAIRGMYSFDNIVYTECGISYKAIVLPQAHKMNPRRRMEIDSGIAYLKKSGAIVIDEVWTADDLSSLGIERDATLPEGIDFAHRRAPECDIYFLSNQTKETKTFELQLRDKRKYAYLADPVNGRITEAPGSVTMRPAGSIFVIYTDTKATYAQPHEEPELKKQMVLDSDWQIWFHSNGGLVAQRGGSLSSWSEFEDTRIKYYSGHATYKTRFSLPDDAHEVKILLPEVHDIATIVVNGKVCRSLWTPPFEMNITDKVNPGEQNELSIIVVNTWANALMGNDNGTPPFDHIWTNAKYRREGNEPLPAGLVGKVWIVYE